MILRAACHRLGPRLSGNSAAQGKILNTWEVDALEILASQEVNNISVALGIDPGSSDLSHGITRSVYWRMRIPMGAHCYVDLRAVSQALPAFGQSSHVFVAIPPYTE